MKVNSTIYLPKFGLSLTLDDHGTNQGQTIMNISSPEMVLTARSFNLKFADTLDRTLRVSQELTMMYGSSLALLLDAGLTIPQGRRGYIIRAYRALTTVRLACHVDLLLLTITRK